MSGVYVRRVETNAKREARIDLASCTLLVGGNAAGKTGVVTAVELALTGRCGEVGAAANALLELASPIGDPLFTRASISDGREVELRVEGTTAKAKAPVWTIAGSDAQEAEVCAAPVGALLVSEVRDLLDRDPKKQRAAILKAACGEVREGVVRASVPEAFRSTWDEFWNEAKGGGREAADVLVAARDSIAKALRAARAEARGDDLGDRPSAPDAEVVVGWERRLGEVREVEEVRRRYDAAVGAIPWLREEAARLRAAVQGSGAPDVALADARVVVTESALRIASVLCDRFPGAPCLCCGQPLREGETWAGRASDAEDRVVKARAALQAARDASGRSPDAKRLADVEAKLSAAEASVAAGAPAAEGGQTAELDAALRDGRAAVDARARWDARREAQMRAAARIDALVALQKATDRIIADSLDDAIVAFCDRAPAIQGRKLAVQLFDKGREVCRVGLRDGAGGALRSWRVLSGAERAMCLAAFAVAWALGRSEAVKVVVVDDVWFDPVSLTAICDALGDAVLRMGAVTQAIVCAVDGYKLEPPGWSVVHVG